MSKPFKVSLSILQGQDYDYLFVWKAGVPAVPVDLTGCSARMQVREKVPSPDVLLELTTDNGRIELGTTDGAITLKLTAVETAALAWRNGFYDLEIVHSNGKVRRLLQGQVSVKPEVTRGA